MRYLTELSLETFIAAARNVPYQQINTELFPGIDLWIRRDDLIDPLISGNKAYKLIFNLLEARAQGKDTIVTCGGAWSNHIHATAAAGQRFGFKTVGIIRGERPSVLSSMLQDAERFGMELKFVSRAEHRARHTDDFITFHGTKRGDTWYIPEGGANSLGAKGMQLLGNVICETSPIIFGECWVACGTGLTLGSLASSVLDATKLIGVSVLKGSEGIKQSAAMWANIVGREGQFDLIENAHHGGYGKSNVELREFQRKSEGVAFLGLDHVYTAKLFHAFSPHSYSVAKKGLMRHMAIPKSVLLIHTGGLQGRRGLHKI